MRIQFSRLIPHSKVSHSHKMHTESICNMHKFDIHSIWFLFRCCFFFSFCYFIFILSFSVLLPYIRMSTMWSNLIWVGLRKGHNLEQWPSDMPYAANYWSMCNRGDFINDMLRNLYTKIHSNTLYLTHKIQKKKFNKIHSIFGLVWKIAYKYQIIGAFVHQNCTYQNAF